MSVDDSLSIADLPVELLMLCMSFLDGPSVAKAGRVCATWHNLANDRILWKGLYQNMWPLSFSGFDAQHPSLKWKEMYINRYEAELVFRHARWTRYQRSPSGKSSCWHCLGPIPLGSLRVVLPIFEHQTPPYGHASCDILFNVCEDHYNPLKKLNAWQMNKFATHESDLTEPERNEILAWIRTGMNGADIPLILGGPMEITAEMMRKRKPKSRK